MHKVWESVKKSDDDNIIEGIKNMHACKYTYYKTHTLITMKVKTVPMKEITPVFNWVKVFPVVFF